MTTTIHPSDLFPTYLFEDITYDEVQHGDRVRVPHLIGGHHAVSWGRIVTADRVERISGRALMLRLTEPAPGYRDRFTLIVAPAIEAGLQRVIGVIPPRVTRHSESTAFSKEHDMTTTTPLPSTAAEFAAQLAITPPPALGFPAVYADLVAAIGELPAARMYHEASQIAFDQRNAA